MRRVFVFLPLALLACGEVPAPPAMPPSIRGCGGDLECQERAEAACAGPERSSYSDWCRLYEAAMADGDFLGLSITEGD